MDKEKADKIITDFMNKIYGFALSKTLDINQAEDLASRISFEVYKSLLRVESIHNIDRYVYRISSNIYAQFIIEEKNKRTSLSEITENHRTISISQQSSFVDDTLEDDAFFRLRNEISYLSNLQREIIVMHYFQKKDTKEIAENLKISQAKVKWHLIDARNQLKDGFINNKKRTYNSNHKKFLEMRSIGKLGHQQKFIDMSFYFNKILSQNIVYLAYRKAKTAIEIANELAVPVVFVEDEINHLVDNNFMTKLTSSRYLTNVYIMETKNHEQEKRINNLMKKYAKIVCEQYIPEIVCHVSNYLYIFPNLPLPQSRVFESNIYVPENDLNFLLWSIISFACVTKLVIPEKNSDIFNFMVKRRDGGENIAHAVVENGRPSDKIEKRAKGLSKEYVDLFIKSNSPKTHPLTAWQFFSQFDDRDGKFTDWAHKLYFLLYDYILLNNAETQISNINHLHANGKIEIDSAQMPSIQSNIDDYINLRSKGFVENLQITSSSKNTIHPSTDFVNMVVTTLSERELTDLLPPISKEMIKTGKQFNDEMYNLCKEQIPAQMQNLCRAMNQNNFRKGLFRTYVLENLLNQGVLKPLKKHQKKTVNMILFTDILPKQIVIKNPPHNEQE